MATRSRIGLRLDDGRIKSVYCRWDSYLDGVGAILKEHYTNTQQIEKLLNLGDISSLGEKPIDNPEIVGEQRRTKLDWNLSHL